MHGYQPVLATEAERERGVSERMYSEAEVSKIAIEAAEAALARFAVYHPLPSCVTATEAAEMLGVSTKTITRMKLPRNDAGKIPYVDLLKALRK
jgi:hypothetical protein